MLSRNKREGRFVGFFHGKAVRYGKLFKRVKAAKARTVMYVRTYKKNAARRRITSILNIVNLPILIPRGSISISEFTAYKSNIVNRKKNV